MTKLEQNIIQSADALLQRMRKQADDAKLKREHGRSTLDEDEEILALVEELSGLVNLRKVEDHGLSPKAIFALEVIDRRMLEIRCEIELEPSVRDWLAEVTKVYGNGCTVVLHSDGSGRIQRSGTKAISFKTPSDVICSNFQCSTQIHH